MNFQIALKLGGACLKIKIQSNLHALGWEKSTKMLSSITGKNITFAMDSFEPEEYTFLWHEVDPGAGKVFNEKFAY